jgi:hypothetical protein
MSIPIIKKITPPTILKLFTDIPKNLNNSCPEKAKRRRVMSAAIEAFFAVRALFLLSSDAVIVIKTGIVATGLINVKNATKLNTANVRSSFMKGEFPIIEV